MELGPNQKRWINELKSGNYNQCSGRLFRWTEDLYPSFCCLGVANVACELKEKSELFLDDTYEKIGFRNRYGSFNEAVIINTQKYSSLLEMNDAGKLSFKDIASFIEANPEKVFTRSI